MDWKYKHFRQERVFKSPRESVLDAARAYITEELGWKISDTTDGIKAEGASAFHSARAEFHFQSITEGTRATIDLQVERAGFGGFMLFDVGGYYNIQMRKWLDGIQQRLGDVDQ